MKAIILAGGEGRRMFPFDRNRQKCFLPVGNRPNTVRQVEMLAAAGVEDITVVTGHAAQWAAYCLRGHKVTLAPAGSELGATLAGLADGVGAVLLLHGDIYLSAPDLAAMLREPAKDVSAAVLLQQASGDFDKADWICADLQQDRVRAFFGHPRPHYVNARSGGVFWLRKELFRYLTCAPPLFLNVPTGGMPPNGFWLENCLQTAIADGAAVESRLAQDPLVDIDFPWDLFQANLLCSEAETAALHKADIHPAATLPAALKKLPVRVGEGSVIGENVVFKGRAIIGARTVIQNGVVIGDGCIIGDDCVLEDYCKLSANTVVGDRCKIGFTAEVSGVLMEGVAAVHNCELYGVIGRDTDIGAGTSAAFLRFDDGAVCQKVAGKTVRHPLAKAAYIGDNARTGVNCTLLPGARVGCNSCIGPGVVASGSVEHGTLLLLKQELEQRPWGPEKYGWPE